MFKLVIQDDEGKTTVVPLVRDEITIGRKEGNTIRLTERNVSRKHARISRANGAVAIEDLGSYNGVRVNGTRISQRTVLSVSDRVQIGDYLIELKAEGVEQPVPYEDARTQPIERIDPAALAAVMPQAAIQQQAAPMALADNTPTARAPMVIPQAAAAPGGTPRLVVLSSNFAGREFQLTKSEMVIGRTDDNDIVVNHRSISRNHAKVIRDPSTGRYSIMDLQSSNGVRVNGEDYGKVELRRGDTVDLGHVRFRFVDAGEDFVFGRDAQIVDVPTKKSKTWLFGLVGVVVVGAVIAVVASGGGGSKKPSGGTVAQGGGSDDGSDRGTTPAAAGSADEPGSGSAAAGSAVGSAPAGSGAAGGSAVEAGSGSAQPAVQTPSDKPEVERLLAEARTARDTNKWGAASQAANEALKLEPDNPEARELASQAKFELGNENTYTDFVQAAARKQYETAILKFEEIPSNSVYKNKARDAYDRLHAQYLTEMKTKGQQLARANKCKDLKRLAGDARKVFSDVGTALDEIACEESGGTVAVVRPSGGNDGSGGGSSTKPPPSGGNDNPPSGGGGGDAAQLVNDASSAAMNGQWGKALTAAESALKAPGIGGSLAAKAVNVAALASCNLKNEAKARTYYAKASSSYKTAIRQQCLRVAKFDPGT